MRDIHVAEAEAWLAGGYYDLAETHRIAAVAAEDEAWRRTEYESARAAAIKSEEHYAAWAASGWKERNQERTRLRQALATWERAKAAEKLGRDDETDAAYQKAFDFFRELVRDTPKNLLHRIHFAKMAAEQGDFLILKKKDPKRAGEAYAVATEQTRGSASRPSCARTRMRSGPTCIARGSRHSGLATHPGRVSSSSRVWPTARNSCGR